VFQKPAICPWAHDLKSRGLLDETLVVWASEMGRTPFDNNLTTDKPGRDHNQYALVVWMAGGGIRGGSSFGETDDLSVRAAGEEIPLRDVHATLLHLMGLDQNRLTYLHAGRYKKLTDTGGRVINEVILLGRPVGLPKNRSTLACPAPLCAPFSVPTP